MRTAAKRDTPERACIREGQRLNADIFQVSGAGLLDTLVAHRGALWWVEIKRPGEPLKPRQEKVLLRLYSQDVPGYIVETPADMRALIEGRLVPWSPGSRAVEGQKARKHVPGKSRMRTTREGCETDGCATSKAPGSSYCVACGKADAVPPPRKM